MPPGPGLPGPKTNDFLEVCLPVSRGLWQGGQDSNLQPTVLETATLPIELPPFVPRGTPAEGAHA